MNFFLFTTDDIKRNIVIVEGGYMSGIPPKNIRTNQNSLVAKVFCPLGQYLVETPFAAMTATSHFGSVSTSFAH